ncbi:mediator complex subunit Pmc4 [Schizosaccharomyces japonicus yFS275]|uniref:Mediator of RNA polymerase II transcription subunit 4 n=1 Tax=Schizosaccharomyces japonicus (strain yFS275 / FY16936) TaxID=402676 RepID=B6JV90_SCHJY|nr:mediator complex subunit Pmc4 [Schizosaccharomyces japonicus yFS275]EEB05291.1 mediator complex subunit Pmc4 [Schizosaccharomyces japonicus yFS275]
MGLLKSIQDVEKCVNQHLKLSIEGASIETLMDNWQSTLKNLVQFKSLIEEYERGVELQKTIQKLLKEGEELDGKLESCMEELAVLHKGIEPKSILEGKKRKVSLKMLLEYGAKLAKFSSAPPGYDPEKGQEGNAPVHFPWPSEDQMRKTKLLQLATDNSSLEAGQMVQDEEKQQTSVKVEIDEVLPSFDKPATDSAVTTTTGLTTTTSPSMMHVDQGTHPPPTAPVEEKPDVFAGLDLYDPENDDLL